MLNSMVGHFEDRSMTAPVMPSHKSHTKQHSFKNGETREANMRNLGGGSSHKTSVTGNR